MTGREYNNQFSEEELATEIWKDIPRYEGYYQASSLGRIKSLERYVNWSRTKRKVYEMVLIPAKNNQCRFLVTFKKNNIKKTIQVSRLVLYTFIGFCPKGMECCHNDGNSLNNRIENLRWDTPKNNQADRIKHGTSNRGEKQHTHKLTEKNVLEIRELYKSKKLLQREIGTIYNITQGNISVIVNNKTWYWKDK